MAHDLPVIDADGHLVERESDVLKYLASPWDRRAGGLFPSADQPWDMFLFGKITEQPRFTAMSPAEEAGAWLDVMDAHGIETAVLFPTRAATLSRLREKDFACAEARAYNTCAARDYQSVAPHRLRPVGVLPLQDPARAAEELRYAVTELGLVSFELAAMHAAPGLGDPCYDPIWAEAQRLNVALCIHGGRSPSTDIGGDRLATFAEVHAYGFTASILLQFTNVLCQGVPVRFPGLRLAFLENGATWLPYYLDRLDEHWEKRGPEEMPLLTKKPSAIFRESPLYVSIEAGEGLLPETLDYVGDDHFLYATDIPHWDNEFPESLEALREHPRLSRETKEKILYRNAQALFGLGAAAPAAAPA
jgi:predicted TIM-barrel fold metal-dependent hydrolase